MLLRDANDTNLADIAKYYTGNCSTNNVIVDGIIAAQDISVLSMNSTIPALYEVTGAGTVMLHFFVSNGSNTDPTL